MSSSPKEKLLKDLTRMKTSVDEMQSIVDDTSSAKGWTSIGRWDVGGLRTITKHEQKDPKDATIMVAAGENRKLEITGDGKALLSGNRARIYILHNNYNATLQLKYIPKEGLDNLSLKLRSRHGELDPHENRFGGYGTSIHLNEVGCKREEYHNVHTPLGNKEKLPKPLENGKEYGIRYTVKDVDNGVQNITEIDYGNGFENVADITDSKPLDYMTDKKLYDQKSYIWIRTNGTDPRSIQIRDVSITNL